MHGWADTSRRLTPELMASKCCSFPQITSVGVGRRDSETSLLLSPFFSLVCHDSDQISCCVRHKGATITDIYTIHKTTVGAQMNAGAAHSLSPDVCLIWMIYRSAAWFCQGVWVRTLLRAPWLAGPCVTQTRWESWDVRHDSEGATHGEPAMLWGFRDCVLIGGCRRGFCISLQMEKSGSSAIFGFVVCLSNVNVQLFSQPSASRWIST